MNGVTKNDLSADEVKLDYEALLKTSATAVRESLDRVVEYTGKIRESLRESKMTSVHLRAEWLRNHANDLAIAADTYAALAEGRSRTHKILIEPPETV